MAPNPGYKRRPSVTGRSEGGTPHVRFYRWELEATAYRSLSPVARCVLLELKAFYNGTNNGSLFLSAREAGRRVGVGRTKAWEALWELREKGFIRPSRTGGFSWKVGAQRGDATAWILTEFPLGAEKGIGTREFMRWKEGMTFVERNSRSAGTDALCPNADALSVPADTLADSGGKCPA